MRGLSKKRLLRKAVEPLLPREVVHGRKRGFSIPAAAWLRGELEPFARETLSAETIRRQGFLQPQAVTRVLDDHVAGRADLSRQLWGLLAFTLWYEHHVEGVRRDAPLASVRRMKVWVDFTASAHPLVFRPLVERLQAQGHEVEITARDYAQTLQLIESHGMTATVIGHHGGRSSLGKARQMRGRLHALRQWAKGRDFDLALAHGSHELTMTARRLGIPSATTFDYEWAWLQHQLGCRAATRVVVPGLDPARAARRSTGRDRRSCSSTRA